MKTTRLVQSVVSVLLVSSLASAKTSVDLEIEREWLWDRDNNAGEFDINDIGDRAENIADEWRSLACQKPIEGRVMYVVQIDPNIGGTIGIGFLPSTTLIDSGEQMLGKSHVGCLGAGYSYWSDGNFCHNSAGICTSPSLPKYRSSEIVAMVVDTYKRTISIVTDSGNGEEKVAAENIKPGAYMFSMVASKKGAVKILSVDRLG